MDFLTKMRDDRQLEYIKRIMFGSDDKVPMFSAGDVLSTRKAEISVSREQCLMALRELAEYFISPADLILIVGFLRSDYSDMNEDFNKSIEEIALDNMQKHWSIENLKEMLDLRITYFKNLARNALEQKTATWSSDMLSDLVADYAHHPAGLIIFRCLAKREDDLAKKMVGQLVLSDSQPIALAAVNALICRDDAEAETAIISAVDLSPLPEVRKEAIKALVVDRKDRFSIDSIINKVERVSPQAIAVIIEALDDPDNSVVLAAVFALGCRNEEIADENLAILRDNEDPAIRAEAFKSSIKKTDDKAIKRELILSALNDGDLSVRKVGVLQSLHDLYHCPPKLGIDKWQEHEKEANDKQRKLFEQDAELTCLIAKSLHLDLELARGIWGDSLNAHYLHLLDLFFPNSLDDVNKLRHSRKITNELFKDKED